VVAVVWLGRRGRGRNYLSLSCLVVVVVVVVFSRCRCRARLSCCILDSHRGANRFGARCSVLGGEGGSKIGISLAISGGPTAGTPHHRAHTATPPQRRATRHYSTR
jgi:hypothetical protein